MIETGYADFTSGPVAITGGQTTTYDIAMTSAGDRRRVDTTLTADPQRFAEESTSTVTLTATLTGTRRPTSGRRSPAEGPAPLRSAPPRQRPMSARSSVAADTELVFELSVTGADNVTSRGRGLRFVQPADLYPFLDENVQVGGSSTAVDTFEFEGGTWTLFNIGSRLVATPVGATAGERSTPHTPRAAIADIDVVTMRHGRYALLSCGTAGIVVADITDPSAITLRPAVRRELLQGRHHVHRRWRRHPVWQHRSRASRHRSPASPPTVRRCGSPTTDSVSTAPRSANVLGEDRSGP